MSRERSERPRFEWARSKWCASGPLTRFLRSRVGRPWDKVHGELCRGLKSEGPSGRRALDQVRWIVALDCVADAGGRIREHPSGKPVQGLFVHPRTGILCWIEKTRPAGPKAPSSLDAIDRFKVDDAVEYRKREGLWYIEYSRPLESVGERERVFFFDSERGRFRCLRRNACQPGQLTPRLIVRVKQADKKEIRELEALVRRRAGGP